MDIAARMEIGGQRAEELMARPELLAADEIGIERPDRRRNVRVVIIASQPSSAPDQLRRGPGTKHDLRAGVDTAALINIVIGQFQIGVEAAAGRLVGERAAPKDFANVGPGGG